jgi:hypothetical protein
MEIIHKHSLNLNEAYMRIDHLLSGLQEEYSDKIKNPIITWNDSFTQMNYSFEIMGFSTKGGVNLIEGHINMTGKLPFMARMFKGKIEEIVRGQLDILLA